MTVADDIKARLDIVDVVGKYVPELRQSGRTWKARCPFHQENTPSFVVFPDRQTWRCFGACATGGDVFSFVMRADNTDFSQAMRSLAHQAGVPLPERRPAADAPRNPLFELNDAAQRFFRQSLDADRGALARDYLRARGVSDEAIVTFGLGYSPTTGDALLKHIESLGFARDLLLSAGLATPYDDGARDMFRGRLIYPLRNDAGEVAGFAGRAMDDAQPKYLNTPQTAVFDKGRMLYAYDRAAAAIARERRAVVVEGYMDVIAAHQHDFTNVVASMGTALTPAQIALLTRRADAVVLALDADPAGQGAMFRSLLELAQRSADASLQRASSRRNASPFDAFRVASIPSGKDPDELIRSDPTLWRQAVDGAVPLGDFLLDAAPDQMDVSTPAGKAAAAEALRPILYGVEWTEQDRYLQRLARLLDVESSVLSARIGRSSAPPRRAQSVPAAATDEQAEAEAVFHRLDGDPLDEQTLALLLQHPDIMERSAQVEVDRLRRPESRALLSALHEGGIIDDIRQRLDDDLAQHLDRLMEHPLPPMDFKQRTADFEACLRRLEERHLRELKAQERAMLADDPASPEVAEALHRQVIETNERLRALFTSGAATP